MANVALRGADMERSDRRLGAQIKGVSQSVFWELVVCVLVLVLSGFWHATFRDAAWRDFMLAGAVTATAMILNASLFGLLNTSPTVRVLLHLPVSGRKVIRWARGKILRQSLARLPRMLVISFAWLGFPSIAMAWSQVLLLGVLLWLVMLACAMLNEVTLAGNFRISLIWRVALLIWITMLLYAWWMEKKLSHGPSLPSWIPAVCEPTSWLLPAKWAVHSASHGLSAVLTLFSLGLGAWLWWRFPSEHAAVFDQPAPEFTLPVSDEVDEEVEDEAEVWQGVSAPPDEMVSAPGGAAEKVQRIVEHESAMTCPGWIEKLAYATLRGRDRMLAPILIGHAPGWSARWWLACRIVVPLLFLGFMLVEFSPHWLPVEVLEPWLWIAPLALVLGLGYPLSNSISVATGSWWLGQHAMPCFAGLPISVRDLLRVSFRVTAVRTLAALTLVLPVVTVQCLIVKQPERILTLLMVAISLGACWIMARPAFIYYRLQEVSRPVKGAALGHRCWYLVLVPLALGIVVSFFVAAAIPILPALAVGVLARIVYAFHHWRARSRKLDWVVS